MIEKEMQDKYYELQMYEKETKNVQEQLMELEQQKTEIENIQNNIKDMQKVKPGTEILVPVANGIFYRATIGDTDKLRVNVGEGVNVDKNVEETIGILEKHKRNIEDFRLKLMTKFETLLREQRRIEQEVIELTKKYEEQMKNV